MYKRQLLDPSWFAYDTPGLWNNYTHNGLLYLYTDVYKRQPLMMVFTALAALGQGPWQGDMNAVIAECSEYTYLTQGKRVDGTMYSLSLIHI